MAVHVELRGERGALVLEDGGGILGEGHAERVLAGFDGETEGEVLIDGLGIFVGAGRLDRGEGDAIAVDEELDIVRAFEALDLLVAVALEADLDLIIAVAGKQIRDRNAAAGAER